MLFVLDQPAALLGIAIALLVGTYLGSAAQVLAARALGDPLPQRSGGLKFRPEQRVHVFSAVAMVIAGSGWAEPVAMNDRWRRRRFHVAAALLARPLAYALLSLAAVGGVRAITQQAAIESGGRVSDVTSTGGFGAELLLWMAFTFAALCVVSLIPCPPTDLGRVIFTLGGTSHGWQNARYQLEERNWGVGIVLALLLLPVLLQGFPSWVGQLAPQLLRGVGAIVGVSL